MWRSEHGVAVIGRARCPGPGGSLGRVSRARHRGALCNVTETATYLPDDDQGRRHIVIGRGAGYGNDGDMQGVDELDREWLTARNRNEGRLPAAGRLGRSIDARTGDPGA